MFRVSLQLGNGGTPIYSPSIDVTLPDRVSAALYSGYSIAVESVFGEVQSDLTISGLNFINVDLGRTFNSFEAIYYDTNADLLSTNNTICTFAINFNQPVAFINPVPYESRRRFFCREIGSTTASVLTFYNTQGIANIAFSPNTLVNLIFYKESDNNVTYPITF